jgi:hypothetical protein
MNPPDHRISVILPVYNEESCIESTLRELFGTLAGIPRGSEVLAVDDGSTDGTPAILRRLAGEFPALRILRLSPNSGQSAAFGAGFRAARHGVVVTLDADGQNDPADIPALLAELDTCDLCCGIRRRRRDSWAKRWGSRIGNGFRNAVLREEIRDTGCSLKAVRGEWVRDLPMVAGMHRFLPSLCLMQGARVRQIPVNHRPRSGGRSKYTNLGRLKVTVRDLLAVHWMKSRFRRYTVTEIGPDAALRARPARQAKAPALEND